MATLTQIPKTFAKGESLECLAVGDIVQPGAEEERVYSINIHLRIYNEIFMIKTLFRNDSNLFTLSTSITERSYLSSLRELKQGDLGSVEDTKEHKREMEEYSKLNEFLKNYGDHE